MFHHCPNHLGISLLVSLALCVLVTIGCGDGGEDSATETAMDNDVSTYFGTQPDGGTNTNTPNTPEGGESETEEGDENSIGEEGESTLDDCDCPPGYSCDAEGTCVSSLCDAGFVGCASPTALEICADDGQSFEISECPAGQICEAGTCKETLCIPGDKDGCDEDGKILVCNSLGSAWVSAPCPTGTMCLDSECLPLKPNVLILVDTSGSMNFMDGDVEPDSCWGPDCPPWTFPNCDSAADPMTRLGKVKDVLGALVDSDAAQDVQLALQRFPQIPFTETFYPAQCSPDATSGYYMGYWEAVANFSSILPAFLMTGDDHSYTPANGGWFTQGINEIIAFPFPKSGSTNLAMLGDWFDFHVEVEPTGNICPFNGPCASGPCLSGECHGYGNPELRAGGGTPLGKSLFYAGEYFRHFVLIEGKSCQSTTDCGSPNYVCKEGACHDAYAECRPNIIIAFTDGDETQNVHLTDFFHPRVQAKRFRYGLGCSAGSECGIDAQCVMGICRPPADVIDENALSCEIGENPCTTTSDCPDPCASWGGCQGLCVPTAINLDVGAGANRLRDLSGNPLILTVHLVDASGVPGANQLIAAYGGGQHFSVDLNDPETLLQTFGTLLGDAKYGFACGL